MPCWADRPRWDRVTRRLHLGTKVVREYRREAPEQMRLLDTFERQGWPGRIADPFPAERGTDGAQRLRDMVKSLNRGLAGLHFRTDGTKHGVCWEAVG
jgi:hypothetical protein